MNCDSCKSEFNLLDSYPYSFQCCGNSFCYECVKNISENEMAKCPSCQEETNLKISQLKPNQKMIQMMEERN